MAVSLRVAKSSTVTDICLCEVIVHIIAESRPTLYTVVCQISKLLAQDPYTRITAADALRHMFIRQDDSSLPSPRIIIDEVSDERVVSSFLPFDVLHLLSLDI